MSLIIGVQGVVFQQQLGRQQLAGHWRPTLGDGMERACGHPVRDIPLDIAFYRHVFLAASGDALPAKAAQGGAGWRREAHSQGSVVAFDYLRQHPDACFEALVTQGSPLGLRLVWKLMPNLSYGAAFEVSPQLRARVNVRNERDPVACDGPLRPWWLGVRDCPPVDNARDAHAATSYLVKQATGDAVLTALPGPVQRLS
ncbi:hypothetical protein [Streptomyces chartreusis]